MNRRMKLLASLALAAALCLAAGGLAAHADAPVKVYTHSTVLGVDDAIYTYSGDVQVNEKDSVGAPSCWT